MATEQFMFTVPDGVGPGDVLSLAAPDGTPLQVPVPANVLIGDTVYMAKGADRTWSISRITRTQTVPAAAPAAAPAWRSDGALDGDLASPQAISIRMDTTKGPIMLKVVPSWSPAGVQRFLELVDDGFFRDICIYRGIPRFLLQFGVVPQGDPRNGRYPAIGDDPLCGIPYADGMVGFAAAGPGTRKHTLCLFLGDLRSQLGKGAHGQKTAETPMGKVCPESMETMRSLFCPGDIPQCGGKGPNPSTYEEQGIGYIRANFPQCDFITGAARV